MDMFQRQMNVNVRSSAAVAMLVDVVVKVTDITHKSSL